MILEHRVLITGGAGFIGSHLAENLLDSGAKIVCVDNFFSGSSRNIRHLLDHENFELLRHDICSPLSLAVDEIYNFASVGSAVPCPETAETISSDITETSVHGAVNMMELARHCQCKIFQASGCEVYDDPIPEPQYEQPAPEHNQVRYLASYGAGRRFAESLSFNLARKYQLDFKIGRIFTTYGPRMPLGMPGSVSELVVHALRGNDLLIAGDGSRMQSLCYVDDVVKSCIRLMDRPRSITGPIDIGSGEEISTMALAKRIISLTGSRSKIVTSKMISEPPRHRPDLQPNRQILGARPQTSLETGLARTIEYFDDLLKAGTLSLQK
jgi:UDP-glucuronate decarboxylase